MSKFTVCAKCSVHFEQVTRDHEMRWKHLCQSCREPQMKIDLRKDRVLAWADANWEALEALSKLSSSHVAYPYAQIHAQQAAAAGNFNPLGCIFCNPSV